MKNKGLKNSQVSKEQLQLAILMLVVIGGIIAFYYYLMLPLISEKDKLSFEHNTLQAQVKDIGVLKNSLVEAEKQVQEREKEVNDIKDSTNYKPYSYTDFVDFIGSLQKESGVEVVSIVEDEYFELDSHWEIPYNIVLSGDYYEILAFVNGIYQEDRFHVISDVRLRRGTPVISSNKGIIRDNDWVREIENKINGSYPKNQAPNSSYGDIVPPSESKKVENTTLGAQANKEPIETEADTIKPYEEVLYLDFSFKFISIYDPSQLR